MIKKWLTKQADEIAASRELRFMGAALALIHLVTYLFWFNRGSDGLMTTESLNPICWPVFEACHLIKWNPEVLHVASQIYALFAVLTAAVWIFSSARWAWAMLLTLELVKVQFLYQDYRLMGNYHYMPFLLSFAFLLLPQKKILCRMLLMGCYLAAGGLKMNSTWLSGAAIPEAWVPPGSPAEWVRSSGFLPLACLYVLFLETIIVWGLWSSNRIVFYLTSIQFYIFHIFSFWIVGWFYPVIMGLLWAICWRPLKPAEKVRLKAAPFLFLIFFGFVQVQTWVNIGDAAITGETRFFSLNMFDGLVVCDSRAIAQFKNRSADVSINSSNETWGYRIACDPYVFYWRAKKACQELAHDPDFQGISLHLISRQYNQPDFREVVAEKNICSDDIKYSILLSNPWILK